MENIKLTGDLPLFTGYYESSFDEGCRVNAETELENLQESYPDSDVTLEHVSDYLVRMDRRPAYLALSQAIVDGFNQLMAYHEIPATAHYQKLRTPREHNFFTDAIEVEFTLPKDYLINEVQAHAEEFQTFLNKHLRPRSGFVPYYSADMDSWADQIIEDQEGMDHAQVSLMLQFVVRDLTWKDLYDEGDPSYGEAFDNALPIDQDEIIKNWETQKTKQAK